MRRAKRPRARQRRLTFVGTCGAEMPWHYPKVFEAAMDRGREFQLLLFLIFKCGSALKPIPIVRPSPETERRGIHVVMLREAERLSERCETIRETAITTRFCGAARPANALEVRFTPKSRHRLRHRLARVATNCVNIVG